MHAMGGHMVAAQKHVEAEEVAQGATYSIYIRD